MVKVLIGSIIGIISGVVLGILFKIIESLSKIKLYTLLLNVDFIPYFHANPMNEVGDFLLHLVVSCLISISYFFIMTYIRKRYFLAAIIFTFPAILLYFPLSILAIKDVPQISDITAFSIWVIGHIFYAYLLAVLTKIGLKKTRA